MYKLKPKVIQLLQTDQNIRRSVAMSMGVGEQAIRTQLPQNTKVEALRYITMRSIP